MILATATNLSLTELALHADKILEVAQPSLAVMQATLPMPSHVTAPCTSVTAPPPDLYITVTCPVCPPPSFRPPEPTSEIAALREDVHELRALIASTQSNRGRFSKVHIDIVGPPPLSDRHRYLLTCVDRFTRWPEAAPMQDSTAETVAATFLQTWITRFGVPEENFTDRGPQFESRLFTAFTTLLGTKRLRTTAYHPAYNGLVERFHRHLKQTLMAHLDGSSWTEHLSLVLLGISCREARPRLLVSRACVRHVHPASCRHFQPSAIFATITPSPTRLRPTLKGCSLPAAPHTYESCFLLFPVRRPGPH
ncbi:uncharacterized protein LOC135366555 [Ornithodoros turicata]|uniref:uncharacterized protein LOC135366555 n=1 Tax=Ornithodoros turicata TaxID=34597 RepID=UPI00313A3D8B